MNNKRTLVNLYKDIVLVTRVRIFCATLFTNNNIKVVIQMYTYLSNGSNYIVFLFTHRKKGQRLFSKATQIMKIIPTFYDFELQ